MQNTARVATSRRVGTEAPASFEPETSAEPERAKSDYEKQLETKAEGPAVPSVEEDLFK